MLEIMRRIRQSILEGTFTAYKNSFLAGYQPVPEEKRGVGVGNRQQGN
jgi:queuine/archaeosine tRNA-ribosyltransferase